MTVCLLTLSAVAVLFTGGLAAQAGKLLGVASGAVTVFEIVKWPIMQLIIAVILAILYYAGPNVRQPGIRWISPGSILAVLLWVIASAAFALYVANFASYNKTYGALGGIVVFLIWLWITNVVILLGAELNAELERGRQIQAGHPAEQEPYLLTVELVGPRAIDRRCCPIGDGAEASGGGRGGRPVPPIRAERVGPARLASSAPAGDRKIACLRKARDPALKVVGTPASNGTRKARAVAPRVARPFE